MANAARPNDVSFDDAVDAAASRMARGESLDSVLRAYPQHAGAMREALSALQPVLAIPFTAASPQSSRNAARSMFAALDAPAAQRVSMFAGLWATLGARHLRFQAAAAGMAVLLFGGIGLASAAGDRSPVPVPGFLNVLSTSSDDAVQLRGTIVALDASSLTLRTAAGDETIAIDAGTEIRLGDARAAAGDLAPGQTATVRASRDFAGALRASRITAVVASTADAATPATDLAPGLDIATPEPGNDDGGHDGVNKTAEPGDDNPRDGTPRADDNGNNTGDAGEHDGAATPAATSSGGGSGDDSPDDHGGASNTPTPGNGAGPTEGPHESRSPEPTERPESTEKPKPAQSPEPSEDH